MNACLPGGRRDVVPMQAVRNIVPTVEHIIAARAVSMRATERRRPNGRAARENAAGTNIEGLRRGRVD